MRWIIVLVFLASCSQDDSVRVRFHKTDPADLAKICETLIGVSTGCTIQGKDGIYDIYAPVPKNVEDEKAMIPIGHEFYCHVVLKQSHRNVDPSNDCKWPPSSG
jgi:hypothetical protein